MTRTYRYCLLLFAAACVPGAAHAQVTGWIAVTNNGEPAPNGVDEGPTLTVTGPEGYQLIGGFDAVTLSDGQYVEASGTISLIGRTTGAASDLQRLRDQIRIGLLRDDSLDPVETTGLTGYIIEHRNEIREIRNPVGAPAVNQSPFVSGRSSAIGYSNAAPFGATGGNPVEADFTEEDLVTGVYPTLSFTYRITRLNGLVNISGTITGSPVTTPAAANPPTDSDGAFEETFSLTDYDPAINLSGAGTDDFDFAFNRLALLIGGNVDFRTSAPGNFNFDEQVDAADLAQWIGDFGEDNGSDADADGDTDGADFLIWQQDFGGPSEGYLEVSNVSVTSGSAFAAASSTVPEPTSAAILAAGFSLASAAMRRRR